MNRKILCFFIALILGFSICYATEPPSLVSQSAVLICADTGQILFEKDADTPRAPASITKLMTALLAFENASLDETITASYDAVMSVDRGSTHIWLQEGEQLTVEQALYAMLLESANDAANVLGEHIGGSLDAFAGMMNKRALELGCTNTHFVNANGLDRDGHYVSANDMAKIARALTQYPEFFTIAGSLQYIIPATNKNSQRYCNTKVDMLRKNTSVYNLDITAGKTGWTTNAHHTLVAYAERGGQSLIAVLLDSRQKNEKWADANALFEYGFTNFKPYTVSGDSLFAAATYYYCPMGVSSILKESVPDVTLWVDGNTQQLPLSISFGPNDTPFIQLSAEEKSLVSLPLEVIKLKAQNKAAPEAVPAALVLTDENAGFQMPSFLSVLFYAIAALSGLIVLYILWQRAQYKKRRRRRQARMLARARERSFDK